MVAGSITLNHYLSISQQPLDPTGLINILSPNVLTYTQASAALAIALGGLSLFLLFSALLRIGKIHLGGNVAHFILLLVSIH